MTLENYGFHSFKKDLDYVEENTDEKDLILCTQFISPQDQNSLIHHLKRNKWSNGIEMSLNAFFGTVTAPEWFKKWQSSSCYSEENQWNRVRIEEYSKDKITGYDAKKDPLRMGEPIGLLVLGDEWYHRWSHERFFGTKRKEPVLKKYKRGTGLLLKGESRNDWSRELIRKGQLKTKDPKTQQILTYKRSNPYHHCELIFYYSR